MGSLLPQKADSLGLPETTAPPLPLLRLHYTSAEEHLRKTCPFAQVQGSHAGCRSVCRAL